MLIGIYAPKASLELLFSRRKITVMDVSTQHAEHTCTAVAVQPTGTLWQHGPLLRASLSFLLPVGKWSALLLQFCILL